MFQTAFPFGYLIQLLLFAVAAVATVVLIARGLRRRDGRPYLSGFVLAVMIAIMVSLAALQPSVDEWNPQFPREMLYGRWADEDRTLELRAEGTYTLREGGSVQAGRYELDDWNLRLLDAVEHPLPYPRSDLELRVVQADGEYRIIKKPEEPDMWDGTMGFRHAPSAKVR